VSRMEGTREDEEMPVQEAAREVENTSPKEPNGGDGAEEKHTEGEAVVEAEGSQDEEVAPSVEENDKSVDASASTVSVEAEEPAKSQQVDASIGAAGGEEDEVEPGSLEAEQGVIKEERSAVFETRVEAAVAKKAEGNALFGKQDYAGALDCYIRGLFQVQFDDMQYNFELMDEHREIVDNTKLPLQMNGAAAALKVGRPKLAIEMCTLALKKFPNNAKALFRRGQGYSETKAWAEACEDLATCLKLEPKDQLVRKAYKLALEQNQIAKRAAAEMWRGKLDQPRPSATTPKPDAAPSQGNSQGAEERTSTPVETPEKVLDHPVAEKTKETEKSSPLENLRERKADTHKGDAIRAEEEVNLCQRILNSILSLFGSSPHAKRD